MATAVDGIISVSYRPLETMDELHVLILAGVSVQANDVSLLEQVFSLPRNVVVKELAVLEAYGLVRTVGDKWMATSRGQRLTAAWNTLQERGETVTQTGGPQWLLGPGEFVVDEMIRDRVEIEVRAHGCEVGDKSSALKFLNERRLTAERFEAFVQQWPPRVWVDSMHGVFGEASAFDHVELAETDEALTRLEELLATQIGEVVDRCKETEVAGIHASGDEKAEDATASLRRRGQDVVKKFEDARRNQRRQNQRLAKVKMICEGLIIGEWLSAEGGWLLDAFNTEPAAFIFRSTVPLVQPEAPKKATAPRALSPPPTPRPKQEEEGVMRSLFRWLFG